MRVFGLVAGLTILPTACADPGASPFEIRPAASFRPVAIDPPDGGTEVALDQPIRVTFDDEPDPRTVAGLRIDVTSGMTRWFGQLRVDLFDRTVTYRLIDKLRPKTGYRLALDRSLGGLGGGKLGESWLLWFRTGTGTLPPPTPEPVVTLDELMPLVTERCAPCHAEAPLDLRTPGSLRAALVGRPSRSRPEVVRVVPGEHASSHLVWKLLGLPIAGPPLPHGDLSREEARRFAHWIDAGCP